MPNTPPPAVRHRSSTGAATPGAEPAADPRVARTTRALGRALVALLEERAFAAITVQDILDRAGVGRTAFYAHYRNKHDVLFSSYEGLLGGFAGALDRPSPFGPAGARLFPVGEFVAHVGDARALVRALARDGLLDDAWALLAGEATRLVAARLPAWVAAQGAGQVAGQGPGRRAIGSAIAPPPRPSPARPAPTGGGGHRPADGARSPGVASPSVAAAVPPALLAPMLAGALVESVRWWQDHPGAATPAEVDAAFHALAWGVLRRRQTP